VEHPQGHERTRHREAGEDIPSGPETPREAEELEVEIERGEGEGMADPDVPVPDPDPDDVRHRLGDRLDDETAAALEDDGLIDADA
jgi:hypothetical protein